MRLPISILIRTTAALCILAQCPPVPACTEIVSWYADLTGASPPPNATAPSTPKTTAPSVSPAPTATIPAAPSSPAVRGRATFVFDFDHPDAAVTVEARDIPDIRSIEMRLQPLLKTPGATIVLYSAGDAPFRGSIAKTITTADLPKTGPAASLTMTDVANAVLARVASVAVCTKAHPEGEVSGVILMHKETVYSDDPRSGFHDPALHHASQSQPARG